MMLQNSKAATGGFEGHREGWHGPYPFGAERTPYWCLTFVALLAGWTALLAGWTALLAGWTALLARWTALLARWTALLARWTALH